jgi:hypothetical protein
MEKATKTVTVRQPPQAVEQAKTEHRWNSQPLTTPIAKLGLLRKSLLFAELSDVAYFAEEAARPLFEEIGLHASTYFEREGAQAYLVSNEHDTVVICRGTEPNEWNDIKADVNAWTVLAESVGRVHRGFKEGSGYPLAINGGCAGRKQQDYVVHRPFAWCRDGGDLCGPLHVVENRIEPGRAIHFRWPARRQPALRQSLPIPGIPPLGQQQRHRHEGSADLVGLSPRWPVDVLRLERQVPPALARAARQGPLARPVARPEIGNA